MVVWVERAVSEAAHAVGNEVREADGCRRDRGFLGLVGGVAAVFL